MAGKLDGKRIAVIATDGVEQVELEQPMAALRSAGATVELLGLKPGSIQGLNHLDRGDTFPVDGLIADANPAEYAAVVLPGGVANPDALRQNRDAVAFVRTMMEMDKPVAAICHAPWLLVEADLVKGRELTSWPSLRTDIANAGGSWVDREVVIDQKLITSRKPDDLPAFCSAVVDMIAGTIAEQSLDDMVEQSFPASDPLPGPTTVSTHGSEG